MFTNYFIWLIIAVVISVYNYIGTNWKESKVDPVYWLAISFIPIINIFSWVANLFYLGENQHLFKDCKLNRLLGLYNK